MANNKHRLVFVRLGSALSLMLAGLWAAGLTPLDAFGPPPDTARVPAPQLKGLSAKAGRRITTVTIETSDPVAYLTNRPDPMTLAGRPSRGRYCGDRGNDPRRERRRRRRDRWSRRPAATACASRECESG